MQDTDRYPAAYVEACRDEIAGQIRAYRDLVGAASKASGMSLTRIDAALAAFEPAFFNNLLIALDARFARRPRDPATAPVRRRGAHAGRLADGATAACCASNRTIAYDADDRAADRHRRAHRAECRRFRGACAAFLAEIGGV